MNSIITECCAGNRCLISCVAVGELLPFIIYAHAHTRRFSDKERKKETKRALTQIFAWTCARCNVPSELQRFRDVLFCSRISPHQRREMVLAQVEARMKVHECHIFSSKPTDNFFSLCACMFARARVCVYLRSTWFVSSCLSTCLPAFLSVGVFMPTSEEEGAEGW